MAPRLVVLGGINGAGKSTVVDYMTATPDYRDIPFFNPDRATAEFQAADPSLSPMAANFKGLRSVAEAMERHMAAGMSFGTETVFANESYVRLCHRAKTSGYGVTLLFVGVPAVEDSIKRVAMRVANGGHDVPEADIRRR